MNHNPNHFFWVTIFFAFVLFLICFFTVIIFVEIWVFLEIVLSLFSMSHERDFCWRLLEDLISYFSDFRGDVVEELIFIFINFLFSPVAHLYDESSDNVSSEMFLSGEYTSSILDSLEEGK